MRLKTLLGGFVAITAIGLAGWVFYESRSAWIDAGFVGILYDANSGVVPKTFPPSRIFVGWRQRLYVYPTKLMSAKYVQDASEGEQKTADGILITTSDNANTMFDVAVVYRIRPEDALKVFNSFGPVDVEIIQSNHLRRAIKDVVNEIGPKYDVFELMGPKRSEFCEQATASLRSRMAANGISIDSVMLMTAFPAPETNEKITRRVNQYTEYDIAVLRRQIAEVSRQANVITAEAQAQAAKLTASTAVQQGLDQLQLKADEEAIEKWDGRLPALRIGGNQTTIVDGNTIAALAARRDAVRPQSNNSRGQNPQPGGDTQQ